MRWSVERRERSSHWRVSNSQGARLEHTYTHRVVPSLRASCELWLGASGAARAGLGTPLPVSVTGAPLSLTTKRGVEVAEGGDQMTTVDQLRDVLQGQRTRVTALRERVQDKYLRDCLVSAAGVLDIVRLSISPATMAEPRFASSRAWWLQQTEKLLGGASAQIDFVDDYMRKFGDVKSFPF
jgi:hypothetical protein